ncbi:MAG: 4'-phosphopantetheinyl transferase superfamily protein [Bacteroidota bacterium]|nr:4'-phosphopantetheinyl transferase superfamily protein [Bacteroidota bacterium]
MPLFYQQDINLTTRLGIWKIGEDADFFLRSVPLQRDIAHPHKRLQHLAGRYLLPFLFPDFPHSEILIADTRKPFLPDEQYHFSISHCGDFAAAIVSTTDRVGIDIEIITPRVDKIKHKFLHPEELGFVHSYPTEKQISLLTLLWSCKEAMFKWWGRGDVDFSEVMRVFPFEMQLSGEIKAVFEKDGFHASLQLHYRLTETTSLVWLTTR